MHEHFCGYHDIFYSGFPIKILLHFETCKFGIHYIHILFAGLPPFEWWKTPPDAVLMNVYIFNYTNSEAFLNGTDDKLKVEEIGPIVYL